MVIEAVKESDHAQWQALFTAYGRFYKVDISGAALNTAWSWIHDDAQQFWCAVARDETGTLIGFTQYQLMHRSLSGGMVCYLSDLYVDPQVRGGGTGRALIDHVISEMKSRSINNVRWLTAEDNATARRLYDTYQPPSGFILYSVPVET
jgi:ribosomal protein S18 acetylase RimI-like enzyme